MTSFRAARHVVRLPSGFTTVVLPMVGLHQTQVSLFVPVGSRYEAPGLCGISHFLEHVVFRGSRALGDGAALNRAFEAVGGMLNAHTGVEATEFELTCHPAHLDEALRLLAEVVRAPTFAEVEKERRILLDELSYDYNEHGALVNLGTLSSQSLWPDHALGRPVGGVPETVGALDAAALRAHHAAFYRPERMVLAVAGAVEPEAAAQAAERHFGGWTQDDAPGAAGAPPAPAAERAPEPRAGGPHLTTVQDGDNQVHLQLSFPAPGYNDADELALNLLSRTLDDGPTSRLQRVIREERALVYHIGAGCAGYWDTGAFELSTSVRPAALGELLGELLALLADVRDNGPGEDELERARVRHRFELEFERDSPGARIARHAWPLLHSTVREEAAEREQLAALRHEHLAALAARVLDARGMNAVLVGPVDAAAERAVRAALARY